MGCLCDVTDCSGVMWRDVATNHVVVVVDGDDGEAD